MEWRGVGWTSVEWAGVLWAAVGWCGVGWCGGITAWLCAVLDARAALILQQPHSSTLSHSTPHHLSPALIVHRAYIITIDCMAAKRSAPPPQPSLQQQRTGTLAGLGWPSSSPRDGTGRLLQTQERQHHHQKAVQGQYSPEPPQGTTGDTAVQVSWGRHQLAALAPTEQQTQTGSCQQG